LAIEKLAVCTLPTQNLMKHSIIGGDLNLPQAKWKRDGEKASRFLAIVNSLVWGNGYIPVVSRFTVGYIYILSDLKVCLSHVIFCLESVTITGFYWK
jgi:hypothetical protein